MTATLDLALLGNGRIAMLVDAVGAVVWGCFPQIDGDPVFCALLDAQLLAQVYVELTGGRQIGLGLLADKPAASAATVAAAPRVARPLRVFDVPAGELAAHQAFISALADPLWGPAERM